MGAMTVIAILELVAPNIPVSKNKPRELLVSSINYVHINIYIYRIYINRVLILLN